MAYQRNYWNAGQNARARTRRDPIDILEKIATWSMTLSREAKRDEEAKIEYHSRYLDALVGDNLSSNYDNTEIEKIKEKITDYNKKSNIKDNSKAQELTELYLNRLEVQIRQNNDYNDRYALHASHSDNVDAWVEDMHYYGILEKDGDENAMAAHRNKNDDFMKSQYSKDDKGYKEFQTNQMKNHMNIFADDMKDFAAKYQHRIPNAIWASIGDTQYYMSNILEDWRKDFKIDDDEFFAYNDMIQHGDKKRVDDLKKVKTSVFEKKIDNIHNLLAVEVDAYAKTVFPLIQGEIKLSSEDLSSYYPDGDYLAGGISATSDFHYIQFEDRKYTGDDPILKKKAEIANILYMDLKEKELISKTKLLNYNRTLEGENIYNSLQDYGWVE